jgi:hypothetical protein
MPGVACARLHLPAVTALQCCSAVAVLGPYHLQCLQGVERGLCTACMAVRCPCSAVILSLFGMVILLVGLRLTGVIESGFGVAPFLGVTLAGKNNV